MSPTAFLRKVVVVLEEARVPHMLTGSLAAAYYAVPRATQDVDVVIETQEDGIERLVEGLLAAGWYVDRDAALEAWQHRGQFNTIEPESGWKADFIIFAQLLSRTWSHLDRPYLERWVAELGLQGEWTAAVASLDEAPDSGDT